MSTLRDRVRDFWDRISPRERRLVVIGAIVAPITLALWLGFAIHDGLDAMEQRNVKTRKALDVLADLRARGATPAAGDDVTAKLGTEPLSLDTYLNNAAKKAKFELKETISPHQPVTKNKFVTSSSSVTIDKRTINEIKDFLGAIETDSHAVAITHLELRRDFRDKDKLSTTIEVSSYSREPEAAGSGAGAGGVPGSGSGKKGG